uniref:Uncharacterized protein n=1 Tax=Meloidogyne javanica TaxID=6303 RepID=A0A915N6S5_MELJA
MDGSVLPIVFIGITVC